MEPTVVRLATESPVQDANGGFVLAICCRAGPYCTDRSSARQDAKASRLKYLCKELLMTRSNAISVLILAIAILSLAPNWTHSAPLKSVDAVLDRYKQALGGADSIAKVQSETVYGEIDGTGIGHGGI
jgi:hypothetical protein